MQKGIWEFNLIDGKNPTHTGGFLTGYDQRAFSQEEVVARETGQNAMDAGRNTPGITQIVFQKLQASGEQKHKILDLLELNTILGSRISVFNKEERHKLFAKSAEEFLQSDTLNALLIRDYNTCGLAGKWDRYERHDHFARLVCALNLDDKADGDASSGGSFGLGKTAYAKSSKINTVVYHSVFNPSIDTGSKHRRLMVAGVYPKHELNGVSYGGFAYYGQPTEENSKVAAPFQDEHADAVWSQISEAFGADLSRPRTRTGTDILILMDSLDLKDLKKAVEDYYFPALISSDLSVTFIDETGARDQPSVLSRDDLDQFVKLYKKAKGSEVVKEEQLQVDSFNKRANLELGRYAFQAAEPDEAKSSRNNCVAIMRGTGMVINYEKVGGDQYEPAVGVFIAHQDIYEYLQTAENAAHSEWSEHSPRLHQKFPDNGRLIVSNVNSVIKRRFIDFQKNLQPDVSISRSESGLLARLLTGALSGTKGDKGVEKPFHNPVSLSLIKKDRGTSVSTWSLKIRENEHTPAEPFSLTIMPMISLSGEKQIAIKHMDFIIKDVAGEILSNTSDPKLVYSFSRDMRLDFTVEIPNPGNKNYIVQCKCLAENGDFNVV